MKGHSPTAVCQVENNYSKKQWKDSGCSSSRYWLYWPWSLQFPGGCLPTPMAQVSAPQPVRTFGRLGCKSSFEGRSTTDNYLLPKECDFNLDFFMWWSVQSYQQLHQNNEGNKQHFRNKTQTRVETSSVGFSCIPLNPPPQMNRGRLARLLLAACLQHPGLGLCAQQGWICALTAQTPVVLLWPSLAQVCGHISVQLVHAPTGGLALCRRGGSTWLRVKAAGTESICCHVLKES